MLSDKKVYKKAFTFRLRIIRKGYKDDIIIINHWSIHHQEFIEAFKAILFIHQLWSNIKSFICKHMCVIRVLSCSCHFMQHMWLHSRRKASLSVIVDLRYILSLFISVFAILQSRLVHKPGFDLGNRLFTTFYLFLCVGNRYKYVILRIKIIYRDE